MSHRGLDCQGSWSKSECLLPTESASWAKDSGGRAGGLVGLHTPVLFTQPLGLLIPLGLDRAGHGEGGGGKEASGRRKAVRQPAGFQAVRDQILLELLIGQAWGTYLSTRMM